MGVAWCAAAGTAATRSLLIAAETVTTGLGDLVHSCKFAVPQKTVQEFSLTSFHAE